MMPSEIPQLTPLSVSNPGDSFDPADPWFDALDPSKQGNAFSRRYGFVMGETSDLLPQDTQMWIRKLSGTSDLKIFRYSGTEPKALEPIFGTGGVTNALHWNGMMFHPVVAAPAGTNVHVAEFEVYLVNSVTGVTVEGSSSGPLRFEFTNVAADRPALSLARKIVLSWPSETPTNWVLESAISVDSPVWTTVTNVPVIIDGQPSVILEEGVQKFFRLRSPE
jgi:hypothetical protein